VEEKSPFRRGGGRWWEEKKRRKTKTYRWTEDGAHAEEEKKKGGGGGCSGKRGRKTDLIRDRDQKKALGGKRDFLPEKDRFSENPVEGKKKSRKGRPRTFLREGRKGQVRLLLESMQKPIWGKKKSPFLLFGGKGPLRFLSCQGRGGKKKKGGPLARVTKE